MKILQQLPPQCVAYITSRGLYAQDGAVFGVDVTSREVIPATPYRYLLFRDDASHEDHVRTLGFIMLNPSTADHLADDPTIRRCRGFAEAWGFRRLLIGNAYAFRATDPKAMKAAPDPIGPHNDALLDFIAGACATVVVAWGKHASAERARAVFEIIDRRREPMCLGTNGDGSPKHPLYLKRDAKLTPWVPPA